MPEPPLPSLTLVRVGGGRCEEDDSAALFERPRFDDS